MDQCIEFFSSEFNADFTFAQVDKYVKLYGGNKNYKVKKEVETLKFIGYKLCFPKWILRSLVVFRITAGT